MVGNEEDGPGYLAMRRAVRATRRRMGQDDLQ